MSKAPKKIKVGHITYDLDITKEALFDQGTEVWGLHSLHKKHVRVSSEVTPGPHQAEIITHEVFHALFDHFELLQMEGMNGAREEFLVSTLSKGLVMVLKDNPKLFKYLSEIVEEKK